jgi:polyferredoxin
MIAATTAGGPPWWTWVIIGVAVAIALSGDVYVYRDGRSRGLSGEQIASWIAGCAFMWIVFVPLWFVLRGDYVAGKDPGMGR